MQIQEETSGVALTHKGEAYARRHENLEYFRALARLRREAQAEIDRLLAFLDELDGDPDLEDGSDDEPSLGWQEGRQGATFAPAGDDLELDTVDDEDDGTAEPSLGAPDRNPKVANWPFCVTAYPGDGDQSNWASGDRRDLEEVCEDEGSEHDGCEPCCEDEGAQADDEACKPDDEFSLGWPESVCQGRGLLNNARGDDEANGPAYS